MEEKEFLLKTRPAEYHKQVDFHIGKLAPVGFAARFDRYYPEIIGGDTGCGYLCFKVPYVEIDFSAFQQYLQTNVLLQEHFSYSDRELTELFNYACSQDKSSVQQFGFDAAEQFIKSLHEFNKVFRKSVQMQSLGTSNHFIEVSYEHEGNLYVTIHTGSRNAGIEAFNEFQSICEEMEEYETQDLYFAALREQLAQGKQVEVPLLLHYAFERHLSEIYRAKTPELMKNVKIMHFVDENKLIPLPEECNQQYLGVQRFLCAAAMLNRFSIMRAINKYLMPEESEIVSSKAHNIIVDSYTLKGCQRVEEGELFIVCLNCRDGVLFCRSSREFVPHGAGRRIKKSEAVKLQSQEVQIQRYWRGASEEPMSYKDSDFVKAELEKQGIEIVFQVGTSFNYRFGK